MLKYFGHLALLAMFCSPSTAQDISPVMHYTGSTPCDSAIRSVLRIPVAFPCDFIRWQLQLVPNASAFYLVAQYGVSKPNTNGFMNNGNLVKLQGRYSNKLPSLPQSKRIYALTADGMANPLWLVEIHPSLLHMQDRSGKLLVGNGGWSYVLNKTGDR